MQFFAGNFRGKRMLLEREQEKNIGSLNGRWELIDGGNDEMMTSMIETFVKVYLKLGKVKGQMFEMCLIIAKFLNQGTRTRNLFE